MVDTGEGKRTGSVYCGLNRSRADSLQESLLESTRHLAEGLLDLGLGRLWGGTHPCVKVHFWSLGLLKGIDQVEDLKVPWSKKTAIRVESLIRSLCGVPGEEEDQAVRRE